MSGASLLTVPHIFCDFEYRDDGRQLILGCFLVAQTGERITIDFRPQPGDRVDDATNGLTKEGSVRMSRMACRQLQALTVRFKAAVWFSYAAHAEISAMLTAGVEVSAMHWVCLSAEGRQITTSHAQYFVNPRDTNLLTTLDVFGIPTEGNRAHKEVMRNLILSSDQYTPEQWQLIVLYCWSDILPLPTLWQAIQAVYADAQVSFDIIMAVFRGDYLKATESLEFRSRGFPINVPLLERIYGNRAAVVKVLVEQCNAKYAAPIYQQKKPQGFKFTFKELYKVIDQQPVPVNWELTTSGRPRMDEDYLNEFVQRNPYFKSLLDTYFLLNHFAKHDLRGMVRDGFIKGVSLPFHTTTGRNQPLVARGFMLNMRPWLRSLVRPEPNHVLVAADWSQQEIVVSAAMSGDRKLRAMLETGDVYLALAKEAGAIPADGTKKSHPVQRQVYKSAQLGLGFGMRHRTLGNTMFIDLRNQAIQFGLPMPVLEECISRAQDILQWHRATFTEFWEWSGRAVWVGQQDGYMRTEDCWTTFCNLNSSPLRLGNFPVQGNAAAILRQAIKRLAKFPQIEFVCSLHDAIYIYCHEDDVERHTAILTDCMTRAVTAVLANTKMPMPIKVDVKRYTHATGYIDERDTTTLPSILSVLDSQGL